MNDFESRKVEDCFDGSRIYEYRLTQRTLDEALIKSLAAIGELEYFPKFPRPFFRVRSRDGLQLKGVQGERTFQVILPGKVSRSGYKEQRSRKERFENELRKILSSHYAP